MVPRRAASGSLGRDGPGRSAHAHETVQFLAPALRLGTGLLDLEFDLERSGLLLLPFEIVDVARVMQAFREFDGRGLNFGDRLQPLEQLLLALQVEERLACFKGEVRDLARDPEPRLVQLSLRDSLPRRKQQEVEDFLGQSKLRIAPAARVREAPAHGERRILRRDRQRELRLRDAEFLQRGPEVAVVRRARSATPSPR